MIRLTPLFLALSLPICIGSARGPEPAPADEEELLRRQSHFDERTQALALAYRKAPSAELEAELRAALHGWFDVRQDLRAFELVEMRDEHAENGEALERRAADPEEIAISWFEGALDYAGEEWLEDLEVELAEAWGEAFRDVDDDLADWWDEIVKTDPEGVPTTLAAWCAQNPELHAEIRATNGTGIALMEHELAINRFVFEKDLPRFDGGEMQDTIERVFEGGEWPEVRTLADRIAQLDLAIQREQHAERARSIDAFERATNERAKRREIVVEAELLRRTGRGDVLKW